MLSAPGLTDKILSQRDRIEGENKQVTVMFCDLKGFTPLSEKLNPEVMYAMMDQVYEILIHKVHEFEGTVNEMTGDGSPITAHQTIIKASYMKPSSISWRGWYIIKKHL